jgi:hypothetical protein
VSSNRPLSIVAFATGLFLAACGGGPVATPGPTPEAPASPSPIVSPAPPSGAVVVTFRVLDEEYRILLTDPQDIDNARRLLAGEEAPSIPNGVIVRGEPGVNVGYSWHIDPASVDFADMTMELCDGVPSFVEDGTLEGDRFCPWDARVVDITPAG